MLPKWRKLNLRQHPDFFKRAKRLYFLSSTLFYLENPKGFLVTAVVPKKVVPKATRRNYLRRVIYQVIAENLKLAENKNFSIAIILKKQVIEDDFSVFKKEIIEILNKIRSL